VVGDRGAGKSFWSGVLAHAVSRELVHASFPRLGLNQVEGILAFSEAEHLRHPTKSTLKRALDHGFTPEQIWRAVALDLLEAKEKEQTDLLKQCKGIKDDPRAGAMRFAAISDSLRRSRKSAVLIFDALDRLGDDWATIRKLTQGVFQLALALRNFDNLHVKVFLRPDVAADDGVWAITDTSKLRHDEVKLNWRGTDLYGLLWTLLANDSSAGKAFRDLATELVRARFEKKQVVPGESRWTVPIDLSEDADHQRDVFDLLAGEFMGKSKKRGRTYSWVTNHLQDASGHATPRSFIHAMRSAGAEAKSKDTVLDVQGIQEGVRKASEVRLNELKEDYGWIPRVLEPLKGASVPIEAAELVERWRDADTLRIIRDEALADKSGRYLLPIEMVTGTVDEDPSILIEALTRLSIMLTRADGRRDLPDLFRVAADMKRKGGIPVKR
jgi:hypothetical protein